VEGTSDAWLCTGDLGFRRDGELFVTGRIKDLLIVRGIKHFPQDLERTVEQAHPAVRTGGVVAVAVSTTARGDRVVVVVELQARTGAPPTGELIMAIRQGVSAAHGIQLHGVILVAAGSVPKTPSGKVRRYLCRDAWRAGTLAAVIASWSAPEVAATGPRQES